MNTRKLRLAVAIALGLLSFSASAQSLGQYRVAAKLPELFTPYEIGADGKVYGVLQENVPDPWYPTRNLFLASFSASTGVAKIEQLDGQRVPAFAINEQGNWAENSTLNYNGTTRVLSNNPFQLVDIDPNGNVSGSISTGTIKYEAAYWDNQGGFQSTEGKTGNFNIAGVSAGGDGYVAGWGNYGAVGNDPLAFVWQPGGSFTLLNECFSPYYGAGGPINCSSGLSSGGFAYSVDYTPKDINSHGLLVGNATIDGSFSSSYAWSPERGIFKVPQVAKPARQGLSTGQVLSVVNNNGWIGGYDRGHAFVWSESFGAIAVEDLLSAADQAKYDIQSVLSINDQGDMVVGGIRSDGVIQILLLQSAVPEPSAMGFMVFGLGATLFAARRQRAVGASRLA